MSKRVNEQNNQPQEARYNQFVTLMELDHERLNSCHNGLERRRTNVHGHVVKDVLARRRSAFSGTPPAVILSRQAATAYVATTASIAASRIMTLAVDGFANRGRIIHSLSLPDHL
ncbi:MAG: hypothetical protein RIK87_21635 [Fuerstiella sp.]